MGTCFGINTNEENHLNLKPISRTASQSTNATCVSQVSLNSNNLSQQAVKRYIHKNKRSQVAYFHENPILKPLICNKLYKQRKPNALEKMLNAQQIDCADSQEAQHLIKSQTQLRVNPEKIVINNIEYPIKKTNRVGFRKRSSSLIVKPVF
ncbi:hypothetical protein TTHERM_00149090 (macronuclear) [Tetrahymena thermophila SB210]|uniref:Uncharacterized protein n=1 Tax=Tetrahymena thermophila (strain SB210) TaxID=312017 RepID=I7M2U1_TETTS|nr:hypothetical protein TTHERM_00149090 [Tetrahymena thermophila SB210]EAS01299.1 hypothetical protein TTHERM_00149090 [Tetrahymena thermophila SB210]|eukprot:XP_001021544.1 hypothetical protein TTHERM_00149090 [Tetrahymena thermophila SB210]